MHPHPHPAHIHIDTHTHKHTNTHTQTHKHTHTYTHTLTNLIQARTNVVKDDELLGNARVRVAADGIVVAVQVQHIRFLP